MSVICSFCHATAVQYHCHEDVTSCTWLKCRACGAIYDWQTDRGMTRDGKPLAL